MGNGSKATDAMPFKAMAKGTKRGQNARFRNPWRTSDVSQWIKLTQSMMALVDDEDFDYLSQFKWSAQKAGGARTYELWYAYTTASTGAKVKQVRVPMHRVVMSRATNDPIFLVNTSRYIDHADLNGLNNTRSNLRICTNTENQMNKRIQRNGSSGYKGVSIHRQQRKPYTVRFVVPGYGRVYGGSFTTAEEAALKYNEMAIQHFGRFALLNEVPHREGT